VVFMIARKRTPLSATQRVEVWRRWKAGESLHAIGRAVGKDHVVVHLLLKRHGGIAPVTHRRSARSLTLAEREEISRGIASGCAMRVIAQGLRRAPSTVSREIARHGGRPQYRASEADQQAWQSALRPKPCRLATHTALSQIVASKLMQDWSPQQISGSLKMEYPNDDSLRVSHETIYRSLFIQARGALKKELIQHLRSKRRIRRSRHASVHGHSQGRIVDAVSIRQRPAEVEDRAVPGHWEGDLLRGAGNSHVITLVERASRFCTLRKVTNKDTATVVAALIEHVQQLPAALRRSLTWDRGLEMAQHKTFTMATDVKVYFCDPQSPWQRGSNENTNGLLRQYLPKTADLSRFSQSELDEIALRLNTRPRQTLGFRTPADKLQASVASTP
jgi:IS30 family transposase